MLQTFFNTIQSSPNGDLPTMIVNQAMVNQPTTLTIARDALQKLAEAGKTRPLSLPASYDGMQRLRVRDMHYCILLCIIVYYCVLHTRKERPCVVLSSILQWTWPSVFIRDFYAEI